MPAPGSSHALVLPSASGTDEELAESGKRLGGQLEAFLDETKYRAVAVVHGLGRTAPLAFDLAKLRRNSKCGIVWVTDAEFLDHLGGAHPALLQELLAPESGFVMTFFSVIRREITGKLHWGQLRAAEVDKQYAVAEGN